MTRAQHLRTFGVLTALALACDRAPETTPIVEAVEVVDEAVIYPLVGRWYPKPEITRLSDRTLTPDDWCRREPSMIFVVPEMVSVTCDHGPTVSARVARSRRFADGRIEVSLRAKDDAPLTRLTFDVDGTEATILGSPCDGGKPASYARFPRYELLAREILGGRRCAGLTER